MNSTYYLNGVFMNASESDGKIHFENWNNYTLVEEFGVQNSDYFKYLSFNFDILTSEQMKYVLQGYLDSVHINNFDTLIISKKFLKFFQDFVEIPFEMQDDIILKDCNVYDFLNIVYENPLNPFYTFQQFSNTINKVNCKIRLVDENAVVPSNVRLSDVGYDLTVIKKYKQLNDSTALYDTGIQIQVPFGYYIEIVPRSSLSKSGYILANSMGIIDNSYRGNLYVALAKISSDASDISFPFKCCQLILRRQHFMNIVVQTDELSETHRNDGGFGSTSK
jgi:dUTP pyrophosphatase